MKFQLNLAGIVRLVLYVISGLVGLATVVSATLGYPELAAFLGVIAGAGSAITGGTASFNLPKAPDQQLPGQINQSNTGFDLSDILPALFDIAAAAQVFIASKKASGGTPEAKEDYLVGSTTSSETDLPVYTGPITG